MPECSFYLKPADTFFFKGHHTVEAGEDSDMFGLFPPRPNTVYGALRSAYIHEHMSFSDFAKGTNEEVKQWMGTPDSLGKFAIDFCGLVFETQLLFPLPLDYQVIEKKIEKDGQEQAQAHPLQLTRTDGLSSLGSKWLLTSQLKEKSKSAANWFVRKEDWKKQVLLAKPIENLVALGDLLAVENKVGIALDYRKRTGQESHLYRMNFLRFKADSHLYVYSSSAPDFSHVRFARLGGENRPWLIRQEKETLTIWDQKEYEAIRKQIAKTKKARIILLTPAIWENGSRPKSFDGGKITLPNGIKAELLCAAIGRPAIFGGWDIVRHRPKKRRFMVPAGSVLYVGLEEKEIVRFLDLVNGFSFTDYGSQEGFGFAVIAPVKEG